jgi:hypothetical protein
MNYHQIVIEACREKLGRIEKKIARIEYKMSSEPFTRLLELRHELSRLIREKGHEAPETLAWVRKHGKEEKKLDRVVKGSIGKGLQLSGRWCDLKLDAVKLRDFIAMAEWANSRGKSA